MQLCERMKLLLASLMVLSMSASAAATGFTFATREHPYANEPQYMYPGKYLRKCPKGFAPSYDGKCRKIRWLFR